jgi:hypothetical protein
MSDLKNTNNVRKTFADMPLLREFNGNFNQVKEYVKENFKFKKIFNNKYIIFFSIIFLLLVFILFQGFLFSMERNKWYNSNYFYTTVLDRNQKDDLKRQFQKKFIGLMLFYNFNFTPEELVSQSSLIFDKSDEYGWDPYIAFSSEWNESGMDRNKKDHGKKGLYQFIESRAKMASIDSGLSYYQGIELNVLDSTKLWFSYMKILMEQFNNNINYALLAYDLGTEVVIKVSGLKIDNNTGLFDMESGNLDKVRKKEYLDKNKYPYDFKIIKYAESLKLRNIKDNQNVMNILNNNNSKTF